MDYKKILSELRESLRKEEIKTKNYIQGYSDGIAEAMYIVERNARENKKADNGQ